MKKEQLITIGTALVICLVGAVFLIVNPFSEKDDDDIEIVEPDVSSTAAKEIKKAIKVLGENKWDKKNYEDIDSKIRNFSKENLINNTEKQSLDEFLNLTYIKTLNKAAKNFFASSRNSSSLSGIYSELKRYGNGKYRANVAEMKNACINFYSLKKVASKINNFDYFYDGGENQINDYFNILDNYGMKPYLSNSPLVKSIIDESKNSLKSKMSVAVIAELNPKIEGYITLQEQKDGITNSFRQELLNLEQNQLLQGKNNVRTFIDKARKDLTSHEEIALQMANVSFNPDPCEMICGKHLYYIDICKRQKAEDTQENIEVQDSVTADTTRY